MSEKVKEIYGKYSNEKIKLMKKYFDPNTITISEEDTKKIHKIITTKYSKQCTSLTERIIVKPIHCLINNAFGQVFTKEEIAKFLDIYEVVPFANTIAIILHNINIPFQWNNQLEIFHIPGLFMVIRPRPADCIYHSLNNAGEPQFHPHISHSFSCLGDFQRKLVQAKNKQDLIGYMKYIKQFLTTYTPESPYTSLPRCYNKLERLYNYMNIKWPKSNYIISIQAMLLANHPYSLPELVLHYRLLSLNISHDDMTFLRPILINAVLHYFHHLDSSHKIHRLIITLPKIKQEYMKLCNMLEDPVKYKIGQTETLIDEIQKLKDNTSIEIIIQYILYRLPKDTFKKLIKLLLLSKTKKFKHDCIPKEMYTIFKKTLDTYISDCCKMIYTHAEVERIIFDILRLYTKHITNDLVNRLEERLIKLGGSKYEIDHQLTELYETCLSIT